MAKEILELEVKSNIKGAVTDVDALGASVQTAAERYAELNENVAIQNEYIATQETELIRLKEIQDSIPKGAWHAGQHILADNIREVTSEIRSEKDALKNLKAEQKEVAKAIRDKTSAQKKDTRAAIRGIEHFSIMGVSLRRVKNMIRGVIPMFKLLFGTIKAGIASTGIGILLLAIVSIGTAMSKSVAGGKAFKAMMDGIGKVTDVIIGSLTFLGDLMLSVFGFDSSTSAAVTAAENLKKAYEDLGKEMDKINRKEAQSGREKLKNKQIIDDETLSEKERINAAIANYKITQGHNKDRLKNLKDQLAADKKSIKHQKTRVKEAKKEEEGVSDALQKQNELIRNQTKTQTDLGNLRTKISKDRINVDNQVADIKQTQIDKDKKAADEAAARGEKRKQKRIQTAQEVANAETTLAKQIQKIQDELQYESLATKIEVDKAKLKNTYDRAKLEIENSIASQETIDEALLLLREKYDGDLLELTDGSDTLLAELRQENALLIIDDERALADKKLEIQRDAELKSVEGLEETEALKEEIRKKYDKIQGKITTDRKDQDVAMAKASTNDQISAAGDLAGALSSLAGDNKELAAASAIISTYVGANKAFAQGGLAGYVGAAAIIISGMANVKKIYEQDVPGGGGGGGGGGPDPAPPAPEMMSGAFELTGGQEVEPVQAYVVSDDITDSQNGLAIIRRRATI
jgi:hypothetical protein